MMVDGKWDIILVDKIWIVKLFEANNGYHR